MTDINMTNMKTAKLYPYSETLKSRIIERVAECGYIVEFREAIVRCIPTSDLFKSLTGNCPVPSIVIHHRHDKEGNLVVAGVTAKFPPADISSELKANLFMMMAERVKIIIEEINDLVF